jgi:hypothetical protein
MTGFSSAAPSFVSEATWGALADTGLSIDGINAGLGAVQTTALGTNRFPKSGRGFATFNQIAAVPEPSSAAFISFGLIGLLVRRKRS